MVHTTAENFTQTMRRSIALVEPPVAIAGQSRTWQFKYTTATPLVKGAKIKFDLLSKGRPIDWEIPSFNLKAKTNVIYLQMPNDQVIEAIEVESASTNLSSFEFTLDEEIKVGETLTIVIGLPPKSKEDPKSCGNMCQKVTGRRKPFHLYIDAKGKGRYQDDPEVFYNRCPRWSIKND